jgi:Protein of unknown function (DUF3455)
LKVKSEGQLRWKLQDSIAELQQVRIGDATEGKSQASLVRIKVEVGMKWVASDGSAGVTEVEKTNPAPEASDAPWLLFHVVSSSGAGSMSRHRYIACTYTNGGAPPTATPRSRGETVRVPYRAQYRMYH